MTGLKLYELHDGALAREPFLPNELHWEAIWATTEAEAKQLFVKHHDNPVLPPEQIGVHECGETGRHFVPYRPFPHVEQRAGILRQLGWSCQGDHTCATCGLAEMGDDRFTVCAECGQCTECGCSCDAVTDSPGPL